MGSLPFIIYTISARMFVFCVFFRDESPEEEVFNAGREFDELYHWHSLRLLSDDYDRVKKTITGMDQRMGEAVSFSTVCVGTD